MRYDSGTYLELPAAELTLGMLQHEGFVPRVPQFSWGYVLGVEQLLLRKKNAFGANGYWGDGSIGRLERQ